MKKFISIFGVISFCVAILFVVSNRPMWRRNTGEGYAPFEFSTHKGWTPDKRHEDIVLNRTLSKDLPDSNFLLLVQNLEELGIDNNITINEYVEKYWIPDMEKEQNVKFLDISDSTVDGIPAKSAIFTYVLTLKGITRKVKSRTIKFIIGGYVYSFTLGSFEKDFNIANKEFELMVGSFHFTDIPKKGENYGVRPRN